jgi:hypothetical protein
VVKEYSCTTQSLWSIDFGLAVLHYPTSNSEDLARCSEMKTNAIHPVRMYVKEAFEIEK